MSESSSFFKLLLTAVLLLLASALVGTPAQGRAEEATSGEELPIWLQSRTVTPAPGIAPALLSQTAARRRGRTHVLIQLHHLPTPAERRALASQGILLQHYVPRQAWIAAVDADELTAVAAHPAVRWIGPWESGDKLSPSLRRREPARWSRHATGRDQVFVMPHADVSLARGAALVRDHGGVVAGRLVGPHALTAWMMPDSLPELAAEEEILWIDEGALPLEPTNDGTRVALGVEALQAAPYDLSGDGVRVLVFDAGRVDAHDDFQGRLTAIDSTGTDEHATHVAGTLGGSGLRSADDGGAPGQWRGMAPEVDVFSAAYQQVYGTMLFWDNAGDIESDYALARNTHGVDLATNSIGSNVARNGYDCEREGDYGVSSQLIDGIVRGDNAAVGSPYIVNWANGNERTGDGGRCGSTYHTTAPPSCAKNPIHVGATNSDYDSMTTFSSWGPCDDGRLKPTISAPGCETGLLDGSDGAIKSTAISPWPPYYVGNPYCGTSMATPAVAGVVSLLLESYRDVMGDAQARPSNALVKAWLIHTARDLGSDGPDYMFGYGRVDAVAAAELVQSGASSPGDARYLTATLSIPGQTDVYTFALPSQVGELRASLAWDDVAAAPFVSDTHALVNDLDLVLIAPDATVHRPWVLDPANPHLPATFGVNRVDNQEQVVVPDPAAGEWRVVVVGASVPEAPQGYALVVTHQVSGSVACEPGLEDGGFEGGEAWTLSGGAARADAQAYAGTYALRLGGSNDTSQVAYQTLNLPPKAVRANLSYRWTMTTTESSGSGYDYFYAQLRDESGEKVLAVYDLRTDRYPQDLWLVADNLDLTPFAGQTVRLYFYATTDGSKASYFYVDEVVLELCRPTFEAAKIAQPSPAVAGEPLTYTLTLSNNGELDLTGIAVSDTLPAEVDYADSVPDGVYDPAEHTVHWSDLDLPLGHAISLTLWVTPDGTLPDGASLSNRFLARAGEGDVASAEARTPIASLRFEKLADPPTVYAGSHLTYTLSMENPLASTIPLTLGDDLPDGVIFTAFLDDDDGHASHGGGQIRWHDTIGAGETDVVRFSGYVSLTAPNVLRNVAVLTDVHGVTRTATRDVDVLHLDMTLTKTVSSETARLGDVLTYTAQFVNFETTPQSVVVRDALPNELVFGGFADDDGQAAYDPSTRAVEWRGELAPKGDGYSGQATSQGFVDVSAVGTAVTGWQGMGDDEGYAQVPLPWPFTFYGTAYLTLTVGSNGNVGFGAFTFGDFWDTGFIPHMDVPNNRIALYYYDQDGGEGGAGAGTVYAHHDTAQDRFILQYDGWQGWDIDGLSTYQVILYPDGRIALVYRDVYEGADLRGQAGVENAEGSAGLVVTEQPQDGEAFLITPTFDARGFVYTATVATLPPESIVNTLVLTDRFNFTRSASAVTHVGYRIFLPALLRD